MLEITIDLDVCLKYFSLVNVRSGSIIVLKELRVEIAPVVCLLFERSFQTNQLHVYAW